jgi:hypothetical protein
MPPRGEGPRKRSGDLDGAEAVLQICARTRRAPAGLFPRLCLAQGEHCKAAAERQEVPQARGETQGSASGPGSRISGQHPFQGSRLPTNHCFGPALMAGGGTLYHPHLTWMQQGMHPTEVLGFSQDYSGAPREIHHTLPKHAPLFGALLC